MVCNIELKFSRVLLIIFLLTTVQSATLDKAPILACHIALDAELIDVPPSLELCSHIVLSSSNPLFLPQSSHEWNSEKFTLELVREKVPHAHLVFSLRTGSVNNLYEVFKAPTSLSSLFSFFRNYDLKSLDIAWELIQSTPDYLRLLQVLRSQLTRSGFGLTSTLGKGITEASLIHVKNILPLTDYVFVVPMGNRFYNPEFQIDWAYLGKNEDEFFDWTELNYNKIVTGVSMQSVQWELESLDEISYNVSVKTHPYVEACNMSEFTQERPGVSFVKQSGKRKTVVDLPSLSKNIKVFMDHGFAGVALYDYDMDDHEGKCGDVKSPLTLKASEIIRSAISSEKPSRSAERCFPFLGLTAGCNTEPPETNPTGIATSSYTTPKTLDDYSHEPSLDPAVYVQQTVRTRRSVVDGEVDLLTSVTQPTVSSVSEATKVTEFTSSGSAPNEDLLVVNFSNEEVEDEIEGSSPIAPLDQLPIQSFEPSVSEATNMELENEKMEGSGDTDGLEVQPSILPTTVSILETSMQPLIDQDKEFTTVNRSEHTTVQVISSTTPPSTEHKEIASELQKSETDESLSSISIEILDDDSVERVTSEGEVSVIGLSTPTFDHSSSEATQATEKLELEVTSTSYGLDKKTWPTTEVKTEMTTEFQSIVGSTLTERLETTSHSTVSVSQSSTSAELLTTPPIASQVSSGLVMSTDPQNQDDHTSFIISSTEDGITQMPFPLTSALSSEGADLELIMTTTNSEDVSHISTSYESLTDMVSATDTSSKSPDPTEAHVTDDFASLGTHWSEDPIIITMHPLLNETNDSSVVLETGIAHDYSGTTNAHSVSTSEMPINSAEGNMPTTFNHIHDSRSEGYFNSHSSSFATNKETITQVYSTANEQSSAFSNEPLSYSPSSTINSYTEVYTYPSGNIVSNTETPADNFSGSTGVSTSGIPFHSNKDHGTSTVYYNNNEDSHTYVSSLAINEDLRIEQSTSDSMYSVFSEASLSTAEPFDTEAQTHPPETSTVAESKNTSSAPIESFLYSSFIEAMYVSTGLSQSSSTQETDEANESSNYELETHWTPTVTELIEEALLHTTTTSSFSNSSSSVAPAIEDNTSLPVFLMNGASNSAPLQQSVSLSVGDISNSVIIQVNVNAQPNSTSYRRPWLDSIVHYVTGNGATSSSEPCSFAKDSLLLKILLCSGALTSTVKEIVNEILPEMVANLSKPIKSSYSTDTYVTPIKLNDFTVEQHRTTPPSSNDSSVDSGKNYLDVNFNTAFEDDLNNDTETSVTVMQGITEAQIKNPTTPPPANWFSWFSLHEKSENDFNENVDDFGENSQSSNTSTNVTTKQETSEGNITKETSNVTVMQGITEAQTKNLTTPTPASWFSWFSSHEKSENDFNENVDVHIGENSLSSNTSTNVTTKQEKSEGNITKETSQTGNSWFSWLFHTEDEQTSTLRPTTTHTTTPDVKSENLSSNHHYITKYNYMITSLEPDSDGLHVTSQAPDVSKLTRPSPNIAPIAVVEIKNFWESDIGRHLKRKAGPPVNKIHLIGRKWRTIAPPVSNSPLFRPAMPQKSFV